MSTQTHRSFRATLCKRRMRPEIEHLEDRTTPATVALVEDILPGSNGSNPLDLVNVNGTVYFAASDSTHGSELWRSDGTAAGTMLVKDIRPGGSNSKPHLLTNVNGTLYFVANDGIHGDELWKSDGTAAGTVLVKDISGGDTPIHNLTAVGNTLYFQADDGSTGAELWKSDGTPTGTSMVQDINIGPAGSFPDELTNVNGTLFFRADDGTHGLELWKSTGVGAVLVKDTIPPEEVGAVKNLTDVNGVLFFSVGGLLWKSDGSEGGTVLVKDTSLDPGFGEDLISLTNINGVLYFGGNDSVHGEELWRSDGSEAGTFMVQDINPGIDGSYPGNITLVNNMVFFGAVGGASGYELWRSDGTGAGTVLVKDINPSGDSGLAFLTNVNGTLFFMATDGVRGLELGTSNGSTLGTSLFDIYPGNIASFPAFLTALGGTLLCSADDPTNGRELWRAVPDALPDITPPTASSDPADLATGANSNPYSFIVTFSDNVAIDVATLANAVRVTGPNGFNQLATLTNVSPAGNGSPRTATYQITPSGGSWDAVNDEGTYTVASEANQAADTAGHFVAAGNLGTFEVDVDTSSPSATIAGGGPTSAPIIHFSVNFSEPVTGFDATDVVFTGNVPSIVQVTQNGNSYDVTASGMPGSGDVTATIPAGAATDQFGNPTTASGSAAVTYTLVADQVGVHRAGSWTVDANGNRNSADDPPFSNLNAVLTGVPARGDWNGDGRDDWGHFRNGTWVLDFDGDGDYEPLNGDRTFKYGSKGDRPVVGDWDGDGDDDVGFYRPSTRKFKLDNNGDQLAVGDVFRLFGGSGTPVVGNWDPSSRKDEVGLFKNGVWRLDTSGDGRFKAGIDAPAILFGAKGDKPVVGDWDANATSNLGLFRNGAWSLDTDGVYPTIEQAFNYGTLGDQPLAGKW